MNAAAVLNRQTLVLNRRWVPIQICTVREAIGLVAKGSSKIIDPTDCSQVDFLT